jgi:5-methylcytosine-specific restriction endonuclease McrA
MSAVAGRLDQRVLVLNRLWQPVNIIGLRRALSLLFRERASVIYADEGSHRVFPAEEWVSHSRANPPPDSEAIRSPSLALRPPRIILLAAYDKVPRREIRYSRRNVYLRDNHNCQYCGRKFSDEELNLDHVVPRDRGGVTSWENIVTACIRCNAKKANRLPTQAGMSLQRAPQRPKWRMLMSASLTAQEMDLWREFLDVAPSGELPWKA